MSIFTILFIFNLNIKSELFGIKSSYFGNRVTLGEICNYKFNCVVSFATQSFTNSRFRMHRRVAVESGIFFVSLDFMNTLGHKLGLEAQIL